MATKTAATTNTAKATKVFLLIHLRDGDEATQKTCGVYSTEELAAAAADRLRKKPGFRRYPDGFEINPYQLDRDCWGEGFGFDEEFAAQAAALQTPATPLERPLESDAAPSTGGTAHARDAGGSGLNSP